MNRARTGILGVLLLAQSVPAAEPDLIAMDPSQIDALGITTATPESKAAMRSNPLPARVVVPPDREYVVTAPQGGLVAHLLAAVGDAVSNGQPLAEIQSPDLLALQRDYLQGEDELRVAERAWQRDKQLLAEGIIAERRWQEAEARYRAARAARDQQLETLRLSGLSETALKALASSRRFTSTLTVHAPIQGVVLERMATAGQRVDAMAPLFRVADLSALWLELRVPLGQSERLRVGNAVVAPAQGLQARIVMIGRNVDPDSQSVLVRAEIDEGTDRARAGQYLEASLEQPGTGYQVPAEAVVRRGDASYVFVVVDGGFKAQRVTTTDSQAGVAFVTAGLTGTERVAVSGIAAIKAAWLGMGGGD